MASEHKTIESVDGMMLGLIDEYLKTVLGFAAGSVQTVLDTSASFLSQPAHECVKKFYDLYFNRQELQAKAESVNRHVDDLFEEAKALVTAGIGAVDNSAKTAEDEERLGLTGLQKQLEGVITLEDGVRERLSPVLASMQFEDSLRQRIEHIITGWPALMAALHSGDSKDLAEVGDSLGKLCSSQLEADLYFPQVLKESAPAALPGQSLVIEF